MRSLKRSKGILLLDVDFFRGRRWKASGLLDFRLHVKDSSIWQPLSVDSCHAASVHAEWPQAMIGRMFKRFSDRGEAAACVLEFASRLRSTLCFDQDLDVSGVPLRSHYRRERKACMVLPFRHEWA